MTYDLIMVVASKDAALIDMTQAAINSCLADGADVNVIIIETYQRTMYRNVNKTIMYSGEFCYNKALNMGIEAGNADIVIMANNDIIFEKDWSIIGHIMQHQNYLSACALSTDPRQKVFKRGDYAYEGYLVGLHIAGWCIFAQRKLFEKIGKLDESVNFWYSDNVYASQLMAAKIKHALICNVSVLHYTSQTLIREGHKRRQQLTYAQRKKISQFN